MIKRLLFINLILFLFIFNISAKLKNSKDKINKDDYNISGEVTKKPTSWKYILKYDDKNIICSMVQILNTYKLNINIDGAIYTGKVWSVEGFLMPDHYEIFLEFNDTVIEGDIKIKRNDFKKFFRTDTFTLYIGRERFEWRVLEENNKRTIEIDFDDKEITGYSYFKKAKQTDYEFYYADDIQLTGKYIEKFKDNYLYLNTNNLTNNHLFLFILMHMYQIIIDNEDEEDR